MASRDKAAPAFIKDVIFKELKNRLRGKLGEVRRSYAAEENAGVDIPLFDEEEGVYDFSNINFLRTKPEYFPESDFTFVIFASSTVFDLQESRETPYTLQTDPRAKNKPGESVYATTIHVELYCRGGTPIPEHDLQEFEVLNIQCQNMIWAAYLTVLDIGHDRQLESQGLRLIEVSEGMEFDNTRGDEFPLTEYGTFSFQVFVG